MKYLQKGPFILPAGSTKITEKEWTRVFGKKRKTKCPKCKHPCHKADDCNEQVMDAAGDMDWCPCGVESKSK